MRASFVRLLGPLVLSFAMASGAAFAQDSAQNSAQDAPGRADAPNPQDFEPAVDTSAPAARDTPSPDELEPAVDTSAGASAPSGGAAQAALPATTAPNSPRPVQTSARGQARDRIELDTTQITGNRELPKVLYIVPWKRSDLGDLVGKPVNSLLDEVLAPVDRDVFRRENRYYRALTPDPAANAGAGASSARSPGDGARRAAGSVGSATQSVPSNGSAAPRPGDER